MLKRSYNTYASTGYIHLLENVFSTMKDIQMFLGFANFYRHFI